MEPKITLKLFILGMVRECGHCSGSRAGRMPRRSTTLPPWCPVTACGVENSKCLLKLLAEYTSCRRSFWFFSKGKNTSEVCLPQEPARTACPVLGPHGLVGNGRQKSPNGCRDSAALAGPRPWRISRVFSTF